MSWKPFIQINLNTRILKEIIMHLVNKLGKRHPMLFSFMSTHSKYLFSAMRSLKSSNYDTMKILHRFHLEMTSFCRYGRGNNNKCINVIYRSEISQLNNLTKKNKYSHIFIPINIVHSVKMATKPTTLNRLISVGNTNSRRKRYMSIVFIVLEH